MPNPTWVIYQPLIVGLGAVVIGTLGNTLLEWYRNHLKNASTRSAARLALLEELRQARETAIVNSDRSGAVERGGSLIVPIQEKYPIFDFSIPSLGLLTPAEISSVLKSYGMLQAKVETLAVLGSLHRNEGGVLYAIVDAHWGEILAANNKQLADVIGAAIAALEGAR